MRALHILLVFVSIGSYGQSTFRLNGEIEHPDGSELVLSLHQLGGILYEDFQVEIDSNGHFQFEMVLEQIAYLDINYGLNGLISWPIEPNDSLNLSFDSKNFYQSLNAQGEGAAKWNYLAKLINGKAESQDHLLHKLLREKPKGFLEEIKSIEAKELVILEESKEMLSDLFYTLRKIDIFSEYNSLRLDYYAQDSAYLDVFHQFELQNIPPEIQANSLEYGRFVEKLLTVYRQKNAAKTFDNLFDEYNFIRYIFDKGLIAKEITEKLLAQKLLEDFENNALTDENMALFRNFNEFSENTDLKKLLKSKQEILIGRETGSPAPQFSLIDFNGKKLGSKNMKGAPLLLVFWAGWCEPCVQDLQYLPVIASHFQDNEKLKVLNFSLDSESDFENWQAQAKQAGNGARVDMKSDFVKQMGVEQVPAYLLIDKNGNWLASDLVSPVIDEGRALIKQLESILQK